jgi:succinate dehydrogenase / fumarate reductase iron-sulfur subunit
MALMNFSIYRYNPETDKKPYMQDFELDPKKCKGKMVLHALEALKEQDPTLSFRRSCGEGVCGSDGMNINGKNHLACMTSLTDLPDHVTLRPLPGFPVIRDLIVDMTEFYAQYGRVQPYLLNHQDPPEKEYIQSPEERDELDGLYECILCACCSSSCPSYWWNMNRQGEDNQFLGPAALLWSCRFIVDTRDTYTDMRLDALQNAFSLFRCRSIMNCADVCPKGLNPTKAIGHIRKKMLKRAV